MQGQNQRRLRVLAHLRGNEHGVGKVFIGVREVVSAQFDAIIHRIAARAPALSGDFGHRRAGDF